MLTAKELTSPSLNTAQSYDVSFLLKKHIRIHRGDQNYSQDHDDEDWYQVKLEPGFDKEDDAGDDKKPAGEALRLLPDLRIRQGPGGLEAHEKVLTDFAHVIPHHNEHHAHGREHDGRHENLLSGVKGKVILQEENEGHESNQKSLNGFIGTAEFFVILRFGVDFGQKGEQEHEYNADARDEPRRPCLSSPIVRLAIDAPMGGNSVREFGIQKETGEDHANHKEKAEIEGFGFHGGMVTGWARFPSTLLRAGYFAF